MCGVRVDTSSANIEAKWKNTTRLLSVQNLDDAIKLVFIEKKFENVKYVNRVKF